MLERIGGVVKKRLRKEITMQINKNWDVNYLEDRMPNGAYSDVPMSLHDLI